MDGEAFEVWLSAVVVLTDQQRGEVFRALALAEARCSEPVAADAGIVPCEASRAAALAPPRPRLPEAEPVTAAPGRRWPDCARRIAGRRRRRRWWRARAWPRRRNAVASPRPPPFAGGIGFCRLRRWTSQPS